MRNFNDVEAVRVSTFITAILVIIQSDTENSFQNHTSKLIKLLKNITF